MRRFLFLLGIWTTNYGWPFRWCCEKPGPNEIAYKEIERNCRRQLEKLSQDKVFKALYERDGYQTATEKDLKKLKDTNCICFDSLIEDNREVVKTICNHFFHKDCFIFFWQKCLYKCPICRQKLKKIDRKKNKIIGKMHISLDKENPYPGKKNVRMIYFNLEGMEKNVYHDENNKPFTRYENTQLNNIYVPNNEQGLKLLGYYIEAFRRGLLWDGQEASLQENENYIHFKTCPVEIGDNEGWTENEENNNIWMDIQIEVMGKKFGVILTDDEAKNLGKDNIGKIIYTYPIEEHVAGGGFFRKVLNLMDIFF